MLYNRIVFYFIIFYSCNLYSQSISLKGFVKDSLENPLTYANVIAKPQGENQNLVFAISDDDGKYSLQLKKGVNYNISVSFMGYESINYVITPVENVTKNFILKETENRLDEVVIQLPVTVKQDTIIYNVKHFITEKERKLKNVLKKLPGVEVDNNGDVTVKGKKITKMLVEGKAFFGGSTKLAVNNIPANAIEKIEVLDNYNDVAFLKNITESDDMAMNIRLKKNKKHFVFGDIEAGKGEQDFYKANTKLFYYSTKTNVNFISDFNNTGEKKFTFKDYLNFSGGVNAVFDGNFNFNGEDFKQFIQSNDVIKSQDRFGALNIRKTPSKKINISGYTIFANNNTENYQEVANEYSAFSEKKNTQNNLKNILGIGKVNIEYTPDHIEKWSIKSQVKRNNNYRDSSIFSTVNNINNEINADNSNTTLHANQNIEWHKKQSQKHTFSGILNYIFEERELYTLWNTEQFILQGLIPVDTTQNELILQQHKENKKHHIHSVFKDFWILNNKNHVYSTIGNIYLQEKFISNDKQLLDNNTQNNFDIAGFNNRATFKLNDFFIGLHYKFQTGIFTFKQGGYLHKYNWKINQQNTLIKNKWVVLPDFSLKIEFNKSKKIQINYNLKSNFSNASQLANRFYLQSYNSVFKGNNTLENELLHSARIQYRRFSIYRGLLLTASINYTKKVKGYRNAVDFDGINQFLTIQMIENPNENWRLATSIRKKIGNIKYKGGFNYNNSKYLQSINNSFVTNKNENYTFNVGAETVFEDFPIVKLGFKKNIGNYFSNNSKSRFITDEPYLSLEHEFLNDFVFSYSYTQYNYQNKEQNLNNKYNLSEASLFYKKENSPWSFELNAKNVFNTKFKQSNQFSDYLISDTKTFILPRIIMLSIGYNL